MLKENSFMHNKCTWIILNNGSKVLLKEDDKNLLPKELLIMQFLKSLDLIQNIIIKYLNKLN